MKPRKGLTLIEVLVVIGILAVLAGVGLLAYTHLDRATTGRATRAQLQLAQTFLDEFSAGPGLAQLGMSDAMAAPNVNGPQTPADFFPYKGGYYTGPGYANLKSLQPIGLPPPVKGGVPAGNLDPSYADSDRMPKPNNGMAPYVFNYPPDDPTTENAVYNTAVVMMFLARVPAVNQALAKIPTSSLLTDISGQPIGLTLPNTAAPQPAPILLDGWHNPIIFVPAGGLVTQIKTGKLNANNKPILTQVLIRSSGVINPYVQGQEPPLKASDRPFWASAGPDANFSLGDDNLYSFEH